MRGRSAARRRRAATTPRSAVDVPDRRARQEDRRPRTSRLASRSDQIAAQAVRPGDAARLARARARVGRARWAACDAGYSCAYTNTIAWRTPTTPLPMENDPRAVFERLFGDQPTSTDPAARLARIQPRPQHSRLGHRQGRRPQGPPGARRSHASSREYLEAVRDVERRIQKAEEQSDRELPLVEQPAGIPADFDEHAKLMFDLLALAFQTDLTRVSTFMMGARSSSRSYPEIGVPDSHHPLSHHAERSGEAREAGQDQPSSHEAVRALRREAEGDAGRRRVVARSFAAASTGRASATATRTSTTTCRSPSSEERPAASRAAATCGIRRTRRSRTCG